jgi:signal transduction histidine kinase
VLTLICTLWLAQSTDRAEQVKTELFWNGYAKLFYEKTGSWDGLEERLQSDRFMVAEDKTLAIAVYDLDGTAKIAELGNKKSRDRQTRKIAVLSNGAIVGYTQVDHAMQKFISVRIMLPPLVSSVLIYISGVWIIRRSQRTSEQTERRIAAAIGARLKDDGETNGDVDIHNALDQVGELARRVKRLETVRRSMVADIAHELRTPIAVMRTQLDNAIQEGLPLPLTKTVSLHDETIRLTKLVRDLQELSLAESGHLSLSKSWFSLTELAAAVTETLVVGMEEQAIQTSMDMDLDIRIYADEIRIRQIIINLIGNALQHARHELRVVVRLSGGQAELEITDDGWGIEEEELVFVFDRFYRGSADAKASKRGSGLGLGLAIAKQFALAHGGTLGVSSHYGKGAAFTLCLPIIEG